MTEQVISVRDPRFDVLFEPMQIGPVVVKNRFFQVPQCSGMGYRDVSSHAEMRATKAEGGWAMVCTEQAEIHHSSEITPFIEQRIWDDINIPARALAADRVHAHGALAGIELCYNGMNGPNFYSRAAPMGPMHLPIATFTNDPVQARAMTLADIADLRRWHRLAVRRALAAGYDLVYVYAGHAFGGIHHFLSPRYNQRTDIYGGPIENRARLLREMLEDTREECEGKAAVGCRIIVDELRGAGGIQRDDIVQIVGMLAELPDLWDFVLGSWEDDSVTSRFGNHDLRCDPGVREHGSPAKPCGRFPRDGDLAPAERRSRTGPACSRGSMGGARSGLGHRRRGCPRTQHHRRCRLGRSTVRRGPRPTT